MLDLILTQILAIISLQYKDGMGIASFCQAKTCTETLVFPSVQKCCNLLKASLYLYYTTCYKNSFHLSQHSRFQSNFASIFAMQLTKLVNIVERIQFYTMMNLCINLQTNKLVKYFPFMSILWLTNQITN